MTLGNGEEDGEDVLLRILVSSDVHLGYGEKNPEIALDSFNTFSEVLKIGLDEDVDMVLLGGDLFHENKPSRSAEIRCMQILRECVLGDRPVQIEYLSDPGIDFSHCNSKCVNYENPNLNIGLPIFSVHGNHDDPVGLGGHSCLDLVHEAGLVNYFGKVTDLKMVKVRPILLRKGGVKVALYGLSHLKDERLHRLFRENKVEFETPAEDPESWCNILVLHQNRAKRGPTNYIPESFIPDFIHLVIWGHEHDCRIDLENTEGDFFISQPGSPVATSLCEAEAIEKHVGVLSIRADKKFKMDKIKLQTVRPFVFRTISVTDLKRIDLTEPDVKKLNQAIETELKYEVEEMLHDASGLLTGHPMQGKKPLLRLRVEYTDESQQINPGRFGNNFVEQVSNSSDILLFKKRTEARAVKEEKIDTEALGNLAVEEDVTMEDLVKKYFDGQIEDKKQLSVLSVTNIGAAVKSYIDKDNVAGLQITIDKQMEKQFNTLMERQGEDVDLVKEEDYESDEKTVEKVVTSKASRGGKGKVVQSKVGNKGGRDELFDSDDNMGGGGGKIQTISSSEEEEIVQKPARGRGGGRGSRGGTRGRSAPSPAKPKRGGKVANQSTIAQAFARSQATNTQRQQSQVTSSWPIGLLVQRSQSRNKKQMFESDSDDDLLSHL